MKATAHSIRRVIVLGLTTATLVGSLALYGQAPADQGLTTLDGSGLSEADVTLALSAPPAVGPSNEVPVGTILDWWRPDDTWPVPDGYAICDGTTVTDVNSPLFGCQLPNLHMKFIQGTTTLDGVGMEGGTNSHSHTVNVSQGNRNVTSGSAGSHSHVINTAGEHRHSVGPIIYSNTVPSAKNGEHIHRWAQYAIDRDWYSYDGSGVLVKIGNWSDGLSDSGSGTYPLLCDSSRLLYTSMGVGHQHNVTISHDHPASSSGQGGDHSHSESTAAEHTHAVNLAGSSQTVKSSSDGNLPPYISLLKIMRIR